MRSLIVVRRRKLPAEKYMPSLRYSVEGWNDWGDGHYQEWFSIGQKTKSAAVAFARESLLGNVNRNVPTLTEGF